MGVTRLLGSSGVSLLFALGSIGCGQSGVGDAPPLMSPSSLSAVSSPFAPQSSGGFTTMAGPGASYLAEGTWLVEATNQRTGESGSFEATLTQDAAGNITFEDDEGVPITLTRLGTGVVIAYRVTVFETASPCNVDLSGTARLDTRTDTIAARVVGTEENCSRAIYDVTITKQ